MPIATKELLQKQQQPQQQGQYLQSFRRAYKEAQSTESLTHTSAEWWRKKSIEFINKTPVKKHVTQETKPKHLIRQKTPVAEIKTEVKPPVDKKVKSQSQEASIIQVTNVEKANYNDKIQARDYRIYQNGQINDFFKNEPLEKPTKVSDICLVNDHYILVKMSEEIKQPKPSHQVLLAAARRKEFRALKDNQEKRSSGSKTGGNRKLSSYLRNKRNHITRIAPIHEEPEDQSDLENKTLKTQSGLDCLKLPYCWQANEQEVETYETHTKISKSSHNIQSQDFAATEVKGPIKTLDKEECPEVKKTQDIHTISGSILKSSLQYQVTLQKYGFLMDSENNNSSALEINTAPRRKCPRFESFYWLLRPFRGKYRKPKPKIQAVVYKTYFVKWTKPPDTLSYGYGVRPSKTTENEVSVLRRCRSAIF